MRNAAGVIIAVTVVLGSLAMVAVALRIYCRLKLQKISVGADDYCIIIALFLSTGLAVVTDYTAAITGVGDPSYVPTMDDVIFALKVNIATENSQILAMGFTKVSLLLYYKRIFVLRSFQICTNILIGVVTCFTLAIMLSVIFSKWPVHDQWNPLTPFNINVSAILITYCAGNAALDLLTVCLPLIALRNLQMSTNRKLMLSTIFSLGSFCVVASLVRLYYAVQFTKVPATGSSFFQAPFIYNILWALIEPPVFITTGCLLTLGPLFRANRKYGPLRLFRSLQSLLLSARRTAKASSASPAQSGSTSKDGRHTWTMLPDPHRDNDATCRAQWELTDIRDTETTLFPQKTLQTV